jgi:hypothetical protein
LVCNGLGALFKGKIRPSEDTGFGANMFGDGLFCFGAATESAFPVVFVLFYAMGETTTMDTRLVVDGTYFMERITGLFTTGRNARFSLQFQFSCGNLGLSRAQFV